MAAEKARVGPGEQGKAYIMTDGDSNLQRQMFNANGYDGYVSDQIAIDRSVNDIRHEGCDAGL